MKKLLLTLVACCLATHLLAEDAKWLTSLPEAQKQAKVGHKLILLDFTGSDWCVWCKRIDAEIFSKPEFADYAKKSLVLVTVDFPSHKEQSAELKSANEGLQTKYKVEGFPTLVLLDADGAALWKQVGYLEGGPSALIAKVNEVKK